MEKAKRGVSYKWTALSVVAMGTFLSTLSAGVVRIALPHLGQVFQASPDAVVWVWLIYLLIGIGLMLTMGRVGDAFGRKRIYTFGMVIFSFGLGLCALAQSLIQLVMFRLVQAIGGAMTVATGNAIITASFPSEERGRALGILGAVVAVGMFSGPAVGGTLLDLLGWRSIFYIKLPFAIIGAALAWALLKEQLSPKPRQKFDLLGAAAFFFALTCLLLAVNRGQSLGWISPWVVGSGMLGVLLLFFFLIVERRVVQPLLDLRLFWSRLFSVASASHVFFYMSITSISFLLPFYLMQGLGFSASKAGLLVATLSVMRAVVAPLSGRLSDRLGTLFLCASGLTLVAAGLFLLSRLGVDASLGDVVPYLVLPGVGIALFESPNTSAIMGSVPSERLGTASAMVATMRQMGTAFGLAIFGIVFAASQAFHATQFASQGLPEDVAQRLSAVSGFHDAMLAALAIAVIGLIASLLRGKS